LKFERVKKRGVLDAIGESDSSCPPMGYRDLHPGPDVASGRWGTVGFEKEKRFIVLANWKMHKTRGQSVEYVNALNQGVEGVDSGTELIICAPFTVLPALSKAVRPSAISIGGQDVHEKDWGPYTGEISAPMLADVGCRYCMIGHSERRTYFSETDEMVNRKGRALHKARVTPIVCIGETIEEREKGLTFSKLDKQIVMCFDRFSAREMETTVILYEPIWAIGTGNVATPKQAEEAHQFIRQMVSTLYSRETAFMTRIVYGGSVKSSNVSSIFNGEDIDGVGIGSDSLDVQNLLEIAMSCAQFVLNRRVSDAVPRGEK
jgi:triosephosphate isomerase